MSKKELAKFVEQSEAFDNSSKLKTLLLIAGVKPATYIHLRIQKNLHDKHHFEDLLRKNGILFEASAPKGFEEIDSVNDKAKWKIKGTWYGYDLFSSKKVQEQFHQYVNFVKQQKHEKADQIAGRIYGYPACCTASFISEHDHKRLAKQYTYYQYYKRLHDSDKAFPFITHTPCSAKCKRTKLLNKRYEKAIKKIAPAFHKQYSKKQKFTTPVIVDIENEIPNVWKKKDGHDYVLVTARPFGGKYYMISWLTKPHMARGTKLEAEITLQYDYALVKIKKKIGQIKNFHHERRFTRL